MRPGRPQLACPHCAKPVDQHQGLDGALEPEPGAASICAHCLGISVFTDSGLRPATAAEQAEVLAQEDVQRAMRTLRQTRTLPTELGARLAAAGVEADADMSAAFGQAVFPAYEFLRTLAGTVQLTHPAGDVLDVLLANARDGGGDQ